MRRPSDTPFTPGSDTIPLIWAGRMEPFRDWTDVVCPRRLRGEPERGRLILGEPGTGKSALIRKIAADAASQGHWVSPQIRIPLGTDPLRRVATELLSLAEQAGLPTAREERLGRLISRVQAIAVSGYSLQLSGAQASEPYMDIKELLIEIGLQAQERGRLVLLHLDEVQNITDDAVRSQLLIALGDAIVEERKTRAPGGVTFTRCLPIAIYLSGLPDFSDMASARHGATFARRFGTTVLKSLSDDDMRSALRIFLDIGWEVSQDTGEVSRVFMEPAAIDEIITLAKGEPFLFQLAGDAAWKAGHGDVITVEDVRRGWVLKADEAELYVQRLLDRLPEKERAFLEVMADLAPEERTLTRIAEVAGYARATAAGPVSQRLDLNRGIISRHGRSQPYTFQNRAVEAFMAGDWPR